MNSLINKIKALKLPDDRSGLKQNAVIDKVVEILNRNEPKRVMPLQVKESDFKGDESHYYYNKNNFSFHIFIKPDNGFSLFYKHIEILSDEDVKLITLSEAVTAINDYLKQLYEEVADG
jgi:hypothetical protein